MRTPPFGTITHFPASTRTPSKAAVLVMPAIFTPTRAYRSVVEVLNNAGIHAAVMHYGTQPPTHADQRDRRSTGFNYLADIALPRAIRELGAANINPVWVLGHSLGAQIAVHAIKRHTIAPDGLYFVAAGTPYYRCFTGFSKLVALTGTGMPYVVSLLVGHWPGRALGIGTDESSILVKDWATLAWTGNYDRLTGDGHTVSSPKNSDTYDKPLIASIFSDDSFAPRPAAEALCQHLPGARRSIVDLGNGGHMGWLKQPDTALSELVQQIGSPQALRPRQ